MTNAPPLRLRTLGATRLERRLDDGSFARAAVGGKVLGLLVYLTAQEGRAVPREQLADLLWGDESPDRASGSLRQALFVLRRAMGESVIAADRGAVSIAAGSIAVDRDAFLAAVRADDLATALAEYGGDFCERLDVARAPELEQWIARERVRLRRLLVAAAAPVVPRRIADGEPAAALKLARRLFECAPDDPDAMALLFDSLVAAGAIREARERIELFASNADPVPSSIADRQARLTRLGPVVSVPREQGLAALGQTLIGRDDVLATLLREAERARSGAPRRVILTGAAGSGKSRILEEFRARMQLRGARIVYARCLPALRDVPYAALADVVRALCDLPGSAGVSEHTARQLVALLPELSAHYRAAGTEPLSGAPLPLALRNALSDLIDSVASERLVIILMDDLQNADDISRQLMAAAVHAPTIRLLEVWGTRPRALAEPLAAEVEISLPELTEADLRSLMTEVATLPEEAWCAAAIGRIHSIARGMPQQMIQLLRSLAAKELLVPVEGTWTAADPSHLNEGIAASLGTDDLIANLPPDDRLVLLFLCTWVRPMDERDLAAVVQADGPRGGGFDVGPTLSRLESLGLVRSRDTSWTIGHDSVAEAVVRVAGRGAIDARLNALLDHWCTDARLTPELVDHLSLLCGNAGSLAGARRLARSAGRVPAMRRAGLFGRRLARMIAIAAGHPEWEAPLHRSLGVIARQSRAGLVGIGALGAAVITVLLWIASLFQPRLVVESVPMAAGTWDSEGDRGAVGFVVQPRVGVYDGRGRRLEGFRGHVRARSRAGTVVGDTLIPFQRGQAQFAELALLGSESALNAFAAEGLRFEAGWWVRSTTVIPSGVADRSPDEVDEFRLVRASINGAALADASSARIPMTADSLHVIVTFEFSTPNPLSNYVVGVAPTWLPRETATIRLAGLPRPVVKAWQTAGFTVAAPSRPGTHYLIFAMEREESVEHVFSRTNWTAGPPVWNDGNDIADHTPDAVETLRQTGRMQTDLLVEVYRTPLGQLAVGGRAGAPRPVDLGRRLAPFLLRGAAIRLEVVAPRDSLPR